MTTPITHDVEDRLERLVDDHGLAAILASLVEVCRAKAVHLESNWQDEQSASVWTVTAKRIEKAELFARQVGL